ncbi:GFA family protein [Paraburkholderia sp. Tr-20389]|uniref:GFA family protein n=1 Tax=Paraburkholderia sp. Tr-20389 TaxID=2703903 RepID=UPI00197D8C4B|nr:GFA family protein [Paraburkholderia sp. Tr-20389]MBN3756199.1 GFA family protein [Paraburkholderia sp. Tr-20389]
MQYRKGGCLCGAVRYVLKSEPQAAAVCHCTHCQKQSGSLFSFNLFVSEADYEQQGKTLVYETRGDSGHPSYRHFCGNCGSPVITKVAMMPGQVIVKAGTLDSLEGLQPPQTEIYTDGAAQWLEPFAGATRFTRSP